VKFTFTFIRGNFLKYLYLQQYCWRTSNLTATKCFHSLSYKEFSP